MKKLLSFVLLLCMFAFTQTMRATEYNSSADDKTGKFFLYATYNDATGYFGVELMSINFGMYTKDMVFPAKVHAKFENYDGKGNDIEDDFEYTFSEYLFSHMDAKDIVETITFEEGITAIPTGFYYVDLHMSYEESERTILKTINIPSTVMSIGEMAFQGHANLESINFANPETSNLGEIGNFAFCAAGEEDPMMPGEITTWHSKLTSLVLPEKISNIGERAFAGHSGVKEFSVPYYLTSVGSDAFLGCGIETLSANCPYLMLSGTSPFAACPIKKLILPIDGDAEGYMVAVPANLMHGVSSQFDVEVSPKEGVGSKCFGYIFYESCFENSGIKSINFVDNVEFSPMIGSFDFWEKSFSNTFYFKTLDLAAITCGGTVDFRDKAFQYSGLEKLTFNNRTYRIGESAFDGTKITELVIPQYVNPMSETAQSMQINGGAFYNTQKLKSAKIISTINVEGSLENTLASAMFYNSGLKVIELPASLTGIQIAAFAESDLTEFVGGENLNEIGTQAFKECKELTKVDLSATSVKIIRQETFSMCSKLADLKLPENMDYLREHAFEGTPLKEFVADASHIDAETFYNMPNLEKISFIHKDYNFAQAKAISSCPKLKIVDFGQYIHTLYDNVIYDCKSYTDIVISPAIKNIDKDAFSDVMSHVKSITIKSNVLENVSSKANAPFATFKGALYFDLGEATVDWPKYVFASMHITNPVELPKNLLAWYDNTFEDTEIDSLDWHYPSFDKCPFKKGIIGKLTFSNITAIKDGLFEDHTINNINLDGIESIGESAFQNATLINSLSKYTLIIPASVQSIGKQAFYNCKAQNITFEKGSGLTIGDYAFAQVTSTYFTLTTKYDKDNIPVAEANTFKTASKIDCVYAGGCDDVAAYQVAEGWSGINATTWDGVSNYKYSFEIVGEKLKRPFEFYADNFYMNGKQLSSQVFVGCDNKATLEFFTPCMSISFDHWEDGSKTPTNTMTLESDTVIRVYVTESSNKVKLRLNDDKYKDVAKIFISDDISNEWQEKYEFEANDCPGLIMRAKVELLDPEHYTFMRWENTDHTVFSYDNEIYGLDGIVATELVAVIQINEYDLTVMLEGGCMECASQLDHFNVNGKDEGDYAFEMIEYNEEVSVEFVGQKGSDYRYILDHWQDDLGNMVSEDNPYVFNMDQAVHLYPVIREANKMSISAKSNNEALGTVTLTPIADAEVSSGVYWEKSKINIKAETKGEHTNFVKWNDNAGDASLVANRDIIVNKSFDYVAIFNKDSFDIAISVEGIDPSLVDVNGAGRYGWNDDVTLSFTLSDTHYDFVAWIFKDLYSAKESYSFKATESLDFKLQFKAKDYTISTAVEPAEGGSVTGAGKYTYKTLAELVATPAEGWHFKAWKDDDKAEATRKVEVSEDATFTAQFEINTYKLTLNAENGKVTIKETGIDANAVEHGTKLHLVPEAAENYKFTQWSDGNTDNPREVTIVKDSSFTAEFAHITHTITVKANDDAMGSVSGSGVYNQGETVEISATPKENYKFVKWNDGNTDAKRNITVSEDAEYTAEFAHITHTITVTSADETMGTVSGSGVYNQGETVEISATPKENYKFVKWSDGNTDAKRNITVTEDATFKAEFAHITHNIIVEANDADMGSVSGTGVYNQGEKVEISATPKDNFKFVQWNDGNTDSKRTITVTDDAKYIATFAPIEFTISVVSSDDMMGTTTGSGTYQQGKSVSITAVAATGYEFVRWTDGNTDNPRTVTVTDNAVYVAVFEELIVPATEYTIIVVAANDEMGTVTGGGKYEEGTEVTIEAKPAEGYKFVQWNDGNSDNPRTVTATEDKTYTAEFAEDEVVVTTYTITTSVNDEKMGEVTGAGTYAENASVTLTATAYEGYEFVNWDNGSTENPLVFTATENANYKAIFKAKTSEPVMVTITVQTEDANKGEVYGGQTVEQGTVVSIAAIAKTGYKFLQWNDGNNDNPRTITATASTIYIAQFAAEDAKTFKIAVSASDNAMGQVMGAGEYAENAVATLIAIANDGYRFVQWNDGSKENPYKITVTKDDSYVAIFEKINTEITKYTITTSVNDDQMGQVVGGGQYEEGKVVSLTALAYEGYRFVSWSDSNTDNPRYVTVTANAAYAANFEAIPIPEKEFTITAISADDSMGQVTGGGTYKENATATLVALPNEGYKFVRWNDSNTENPRLVTVTDNLVFVAQFDKIGTDEKAKYTITVSSSDETMGEVDGAGEFTLEEGTVLVLTATAKVGYHFVRWEDNSTEMRRVITVTGNHNYIAFFEQNAPVAKKYIITVVSADDAQGRVEGSGVYDEGQAIIIKAIAADGYEFVQWNDGNREATRMITVTANAKYVATFQEKTTYYTLNVQSAVETQGTVTGSGIYKAGTEVTIAAIPATGYHFVQWNDGNRDNPRVVTVDHDITLIASFAIGDDIDNFEADNNGVRKVMIDGHVYIILPDGKEYNATGTKMK